MQFAEVLHQPEAQDRVQRGLHVGRLSHAYLFAGPDGVGKEMLATRLAAVLLCADPQETPAPGPSRERHATWLEPCGQCEECVLSEAGNHPDFHRIYRDLKRLHPDSVIRRRKAVKLSIEVIRHFLIQPVGRRPARGRAKVFVIVEADRLSHGAQNAMLKTLEEPPPGTHLILLSTSPSELLPTTRSRCQAVVFRPLPTEFAARQLAAECEIDLAACRFVVEMAGGSLGTAMRFVEMGAHERVADVLRAMGGAAESPIACGKGLLALSEQFHRTAKAVARPEPVVDEPDEPDEIDADENSEEEADAPAKTTSKGGGELARRAKWTVMEMAATVLRDVQRVSAGRATAAFADEAPVRSLVERARPAGVREAIHVVATAEGLLDRSVNTALAFDSVGIAVGRAFSPPAVRR
ncbi:MAG: ATP-binding protein [Phycisphaerae bacterium]